VAGAAVIWLALLGPVIALFTHLSGSAIVTALTSPGALDPLVTSVESGLVTLGVLFVFCTPLAWMLARGRLPFPRVWETGVLCSLLLPPLVIGLLLVFLVGPYTPIGQVLAWMHLSATNTFLALVIAEVYESAPYYVLGAQAAFASVEPRLEQQAALLGDRPRRVFRRVTLPLAAPGLTAAAILTFLGAWGQYLVPLIFSPKATKPLTVMIPEFVGKNFIDYGLIMASGTVAIFVPCIVVIFLNKYLISGLLAGSGK